MIEVLFGAVLGFAVLAVAVLVGSWGTLTFRELPLFSEGEEPTTVRLLPEIDLPLGPKDDDPC